MSIPLTLGLPAANFSTDAASNSQDKNPYMEFVDDLDDLVDEYHENINKLFNGYIASVVKLGLSEKPEDFNKLLELSTPPPQKTKINPEKPDVKEIVGREPCTSKDGVKNLSTYCLSQAAVPEYFLYRAVLIEVRKRASQQALFRIESGRANDAGTGVEQRGPFKTLGDLWRGEKSLQAYGETINRVDRETELGRTALDQGLSAYNEIQFSLPLHKKYKQFMDALAGGFKAVFVGGKYREEAAAIRKQVEFYPTTFLDLTTTQCT